MRIGGIGNRLPLWGPVAVVAQAGQLAALRGRPVTRDLFGALAIVS